LLVCPVVYLFGVIFGLTQRPSREGRNTLILRTVSFKSLTFYRQRWQHDFVQMDEQAPDRLGMCGQGLATPQLKCIIPTFCYSLDRKINFAP
jgi:hypothetical protein